MVELFDDANQQFLSSLDRATRRLFYSVATENLVSAEDALRRGASVNERDLYKRTPLRIAVANNDPHMVILLLCYGASPTIGDDYGRTPLEIARSLGYEEIEKILSTVEEDPHIIEDVLELRYRSDEDVYNIPSLAFLRIASYVYNFVSTAFVPEMFVLLGARSCDIKLIGFGIAMLGRDINTVRDDFLNNALHLAALKGDVKVISYLLEEGADPTQKNFYGETPAIIALKMGNTRAFWLLFKASLAHRLKNIGEDNEHNSKLSIFFRKLGDKLNKRLIERPGDKLNKRCSKKKVK